MDPQKPYSEEQSRSGRFSMRCSSNIKMEKYVWGGGARIRGSADSGTAGCPVSFRNHKKTNKVRRSGVRWTPLVGVLSGRLERQDRNPPGGRKGQESGR